MSPMEKGVLNIDKVDIPAKDHGDIEVDPEYYTPNYGRTGRLPGVKLLLKVTNNPAGLKSSIKLNIIDSLTNKDP
jgi:hypothetical protein